MRKIIKKYENPIDNILIDIAECFNSYFKKMNFTPNILTTISLLFGGLSAYSLYNNYYLLSSILYFIAYFFDCADGNYAREYEMETVFGDYYDHVADIVKVLVLLIILYSKDKYKFSKAIFILTIFYILACVHIGCQELIYDKVSFLSINKPFCFNKNYIIYTKYFGFGTFTIVLCLILALYQYL